jgi:multiple sugar transport system permease protein
MFPQISVVGYLFRFLSRLNLINTYYSLILPYISWNLPLSLWIITNYFNQIPKELDNAAKIDGSSNWKIFYKVILPLSLPGLFSAFLLSFIFSFNEFLFALIFTADYKARPLTVAVALFQGLHGEFLWGEVMAFSTLSIIPVFLLTILFQKYIISGLIKGAIKG